MMLEGLTAQYLLRQTFRVQSRATRCSSMPHDRRQRPAARGLRVGTEFDAATNATQDAEPNRFRCSLRNH